MKQTIRQRIFKGMSGDVDFTDISSDDSPYCQDIMLTPQGALSSPQGSVKYNTTAYSASVNGLYDYRSNKGQVKLVYTSDGIVQT